MYTRVYIHAHKHTSIRYACIDLALMANLIINVQVLSWCGDMTPYRDGPIGVLTEGAYADLILVEGNPLKDIDSIKRHNVLVVVKDGIVYKNTLSQQQQSKL